MKTLLEILLSGFAVVLAAYILPGVSVDSFVTALWVALLLALANATIGFVLQVLTIPLNFLTLGLVSFVITVCMVLLVDAFVGGFHTIGFISAAWFAMVLGLLKIIFNWFKPDKKK
jgi:putative membrane protein